MSTREETRQLRLASWQQIFADRAASGLSVKDYSREISTSIGSRLPEKTHWQRCLRIHPDLHCLKPRNRSLQYPDLHRIHCQV